MHRGHAIVLGAGFRGLAVAHGLLDLGYSVTVLERGPFAGGVMNGLEWDGFNLDLGCHLFDNTDRETTEFVFSMAGGARQFHTVDVRYGTVFGGALTEGLAVADLQRLSDREQAAVLLDFLRAVAAGPGAAAPETLDASLRTRFGDAASLYLNPMAAKVYASDIRDLDACAMEFGLFRRARLLPDPLAAILKQIPEIDARLAMSSAAMPLAPYPNASPDIGRNFYPSGGGMRGFVGAVSDTLRERGGHLHLDAGQIRLTLDAGNIAVSTQSGSTIKGDLVVSTLAPDVLEDMVLGTARLQGLIRPIPMVLYYFKADVADMTGMSYVHLFDADCVSFRISAPGNYGAQTDEDGRTYICVECPTTLTAPLWGDPEAHIETIWGEVLLAGVVRPEARPCASRVMRTPKSYSVPLAGYDALEATVFQELALAAGPLVNLSSFTFSKLAILDEIMARLRRVTENFA